MVILHLSTSPDLLLLNHSLALSHNCSPSFQLISPLILTEIKLVDNWSNFQNLLTLTDRKISKYNFLQSTQNQRRRPTPLLIGHNPPLPIRILLLIFPIRFNQSWPCLPIHNLDFSNLFFACRSNPFSCRSNYFTCHSNF